MKQTRNLHRQNQKPVQELPVEVGKVDGVHVDDVDAEEAGQGEALEQLATEAPRPDDQNLRVRHAFQVLKEKKI